MGNPYYNFMERLETTVSSYQHYDFDLLEDIVIGAVSSCQTFPESISAFYQQLMQEITHSFQVSASPHYLVWPLQKALLTEDIHFGNFWLLSPKTPQELEAQISNLSGISQQEVSEFLAHTQRSRSPDFMKSCLAVIQLTHQTGFVNKMAYSYAQTTTQLLRLLHISVSTNKSFKKDFNMSKDGKLLDESKQALRLEARRICRTLKNRGDECYRVHPERRYEGCIWPRVRGTP